MNSINEAVKNVALETKAQAKSFDVEAVRQDFPILNQQINGHALAYLDNAATTQKPEEVINAISDYYRHFNSNVHRGAHFLSDKATQAFEEARSTVAKFLNASSTKEVIWTRGATEAINLVAYSWSARYLNAGDVILVSQLEHHSNIVPWQLVAQAKGASVVPIKISDQGDIDLEAFRKQVEKYGKALKLVAVNHVSNALGSINPIEKLISIARQTDAHVLIDGAQSVAHIDIDVQQLDCDFFVFSGHKLYGPTGIGILWGRESLLNEMPPWHGGGEMIEHVSFDGTSFNSLPYKFEAGTPDIAGALGLAAAIDYLMSYDAKQLKQHEHDLYQYLLNSVADIEGLKQIGNAKNNVGVFSFVMKNAHPSDVGMILDQQGVAIRTGHHCTQPLMTRFDLPGTARASLAMYNNHDDIDRFVSGLKKARTFFA